MSRLYWKFFLLGFIFIILSEVLQAIIAYPIGQAELFDFVFWFFVVFIKAVFSGIFFVLMCLLFTKVNSKIRKPRLVLFSQVFLIGVLSLIYYVEIRNELFISLQGGIIIWILRSTLEIFSAYAVTPTALLLLPFYYFLSEGIFNFISYILLVISPLVSSIIFILVYNYIKKKKAR